MEYLNAVVTLKLLINDMTGSLLANKKQIADAPNQMLLKLKDGTDLTITMDSCSDEFVKKTVEENDTEAFVMSNLVSTNKNGKEMTYLLIKGYHGKMEKALVFLQPLHKTSLEAIGPMQFSSMEDNRFHSVAVSEVEESSCKAKEIDKNRGDKDVKNIIFLVGHVDEDRLLYDIERHIIDTATNMSKHKKIHFNFFMHIACFNGTASDRLRAKVLEIETFIKEKISPEYPNSTYEFAFEKDGEFK